MNERFRLPSALCALALVTGLAAAGCGSRTQRLDGDLDADGEADGDADSDADGDGDSDADDDGGLPGCEPMDAVAEGLCAAELDGVVWNGSACVELGSGCSCVGADCGRLYETVEACAADRRACYGAGCEPMVAAADSCAGCDTPLRLGALWTGTRCLELRACGCAGEDCARLFPTLEECEGAQAGCDASLCTATGGVFHPAEPCGPCGHFHCGVQSLLPCCTEGCDCGPGRVFAPGEGCRLEPSCTLEQTCVGTGGAFHPESEGYCGFTCGVANPRYCESPFDSCDCGPHRSFDPDEGCVPDASCEATEQQACEATGGRWHEGDSCGHYHCGLPNLVDPCVAPGCDCGSQRGFRSGEGCVFEPTCVLRSEGQECWGSSASSTCRPGLVCCAMCGFEPCAPTCMPPCCGDDGACMPDGCPVPPP